MRTRTDEQEAARVAKLMETNEANRARRAKRLQVGKHFVFRSDEYNFVVTKTPEDWSNFAYYPTLHSALKALLREEMSEGDRTTLKAILENVQRIEQTIDKLAG